jgi:cobalt/nickel transport protein
MTRKTVQIVIALAGLGWAWTAGAHFQALLPATDLADSETGPVEFEIVFTHPMEGGPVMEMGTPAQFGVLAHGGNTDLRETLIPETRDGKTAYRAVWQASQPGDHVFYLEPVPYWEPAEQKMIVHYTKVVVNAFGEEEGWDAAVGFPVEIEPLVRPYGLWTGNIFRGIVRRDGKPVPFAEIEVEYWNRDGIAAPADPYVTQVIKADAQGVFAYAMPRAGWWAFAALVDGDTPMRNPAGEERDVELGGLIWVRCRDMK